MTMNESLDELKKTCARLQYEREHGEQKKEKKKFRFKIPSHQVCELIIAVLGLANTILTFLTIKINPNLAAQMI